MFVALEVYHPTREALHLLLRALEGPCKGTVLFSGLALRHLPLLDHDYRVDMELGDFHGMAMASLVFHVELKSASDFKSTEYVAHDWTRGRARSRSRSSGNRGRGRTLSGDPNVMPPVEAVGGKIESKADLTAGAAPSIDLACAHSNPLYRRANRGDGGGNVAAVAPGGAAQRGPHLSHFETFKAPTLPTTATNSSSKNRPSQGVASAVQPSSLPSFSSSSSPASSPPSSSVAQPPSGSAFRPPKSPGVPARKPSTAQPTPAALALPGSLWRINALNPPGASGSDANGSGLGKVTPPVIDTSSHAASAAASGVIVSTATASDPNEPRNPSLSLPAVPKSPRSARHYTSVAHMAGMSDPKSNSSQRSMKAMRHRLSVSKDA